MILHGVAPRRHSHQHRGRGDAQAKPPRGAGGRVGMEAGGIHVVVDQRPGARGIALRLVPVDARLGIGDHHLGPAGQTRQQTDQAAIARLVHIRAAQAPDQAAAVGKKGGQGAQQVRMVQPGLDQGRAQAAQQADQTGKGEEGAWARRQVQGDHLDPVAAQLLGKFAAPGQRDHHMAEGLRALHQPGQHVLGAATAQAGDQMNHQRALKGLQHRQGLCRQGRHRKMLFDPGASLRGRGGKVQAGLGQSRCIAGGNHPLRHKRRIPHIGGDTRHATGHHLGQGIGKTLAKARGQHAHIQGRHPPLDLSQRPDHMQRRPQLGGQGLGAVAGQGKGDIAVAFRHLAGGGEKGVVILHGVTAGRHADQQRRVVHAQALAPFGTRCGIGAEALGINAIGDHHATVFGAALAQGGQPGGGIGDNQIGAAGDKGL